MSPFELKLLGGLSISQDGAPLVDLKSQKGQALLCYLAVTRKSFSRSTLAGMFWMDLPEADALMNLRKVLYRLKLCIQYLVIERDTLAFNRDAPYTLDVDQFRSATRDPSDIYRLQYAASLYKGEFLEGFRSDGAPLFEDWVNMERASQREIALTCLQNLATNFTGQQNYATAINYQRQLLHIDPLNEAAHRKLMEILALSGQRSAAIQQYEFCRNTLVSELGVDPAIETRNLFEQIRNGKRDSAPSSLLISTPCPNNLPAQGLPLIGREHELAVIKQYLADPYIRLMTILGPGGVGKTSLALAAARWQVGNLPNGPLFPQGVYFISFAGKESPALLIPAIAEALSFRSSEGEEPNKQLLRFLRQKTMLLVLDNFEHLLAGISLIDEILQTAPGIKILVTSREKLNLQTEYILPLSGMSYPETDLSTQGNGLIEDTRNLEQYSAIQLFVQYARRVRSDFGISAENQQAVLSICRLVQGLPLGIVLAAAWSEILTPGEILQEIHQDVDFLKTEYGDVPSRQRSLRAAFNHTWRLVSERDRELFRQLSVFRGGFTRQAAQVVAGASLHDLQQLVNKSLLSPNGEGRYEDHELLRQFAAEELARIPEEEVAVRGRHCAFFCDFLYDHKQDWHTGKQSEILAIVQEESDNIQSAWNWAKNHADWQHLIKATDGWGFYHSLRGRFADGEDIFWAIVEMAGEQTSSDSEFDPSRWRAWAKALTWLGKFTYENVTAAQRMSLSLSIWERLERNGENTRQEQAFTLLSLAHCYKTLDRKKAREFAEKGLAFYQELNDPWGISLGLMELGFLDWGTGNYSTAMARIQTGLAMTLTLGNMQEQIYALSTLNWTYKHLGRMEEAEQLCRQAVQLSQQLNDTKLIIKTTAELAYTLGFQGQFAEACQWGETSLRVCLEFGSLGQEGYARLAVFALRLLNGEYAEAQKVSGLTLSRTQEAHDDGVEATVHWYLGCLALARSDWAGAEVEFMESCRLYETVQDNMLGFGLSGLALTACLTDQMPKAYQILNQALQNIVQLRDWMLLQVTLPTAALYLAKCGSLEQALTLWSLAETMPLIGHSKWYADVVGTRIDSAGEALPLDTIQTLQACAQSLDLWQTAENLYHKFSLP